MDEFFEIDIEKDYPALSYGELRRKAAEKWRMISDSRKRKYYEKEKKR